MHNVIAPNSFRRGMAKKLVKEVVKKYGEGIGAIYLVGSTASKRAMQDSSVNVVAILNTEGEEYERCKEGIFELADKIRKKKSHAGRKWYISVRPIRDLPENYTADILQPEMELLHGKEFAKERNLPLKIRSVEKRKSYDTPKQEDGAQDRQTNTTARKRTLGGIQARLAIEKQRKGK